MLDDKVFKFPDGKGGFTLKVMSQDGQWHDCDENGNYVEEEHATERRKRNPSRKNQDDAEPMVKTSLYLKKSTYKKLRFYCVDNDTSMTAVIEKAVSTFLSKKRIAEQ